MSRQVDTRAGAIRTYIAVQVFDIDFTKRGKELKPAAPAVAAAERFQKLAWGGTATADGSHKVQILLLPYKSNILSKSVMQHFWDKLNGRILYTLAALSTPPSRSLKLHKLV